MFVGQDGNEEEDRTAQKPQISSLATLGSACGPWAIGKRLIWTLLGRFFLLNWLPFPLTIQLGHAPQGRGGPIILNPPSILPGSVLHPPWLSASLPGQASFQTGPKSNLNPAYKLHFQPWTTGLGEY